MIAQAIEQQLVRRIVGDSTTLDEARAEDATITFVQFAKAPNHILRTVGAVTHENSYRVASKVLETTPNRKPKTGRGFVIDIAKRRVGTLEVSESSFGLICTVIVDYYDFVFDFFSGECAYQRTHNSSKRILFVMS